MERWLPGDRIWTVECIKNPNATFLIYMNERRILPALTRKLPFRFPPMPGSRTDRNPLDKVA